jgi:hypothetical protein
MEAANLVLEILRDLRRELGSVRDVQREHGLRLTEIAGSLAGMRRDQAGDAEIGAHLAARVDRLHDEIDRLKRRLDLAD